MNLIPFRFILLLGLAGWTAQAAAAITPPAQASVVAIGTSPLKAPATTDFAPGATLTMEGWIFLTANTPYAWLMGKCLDVAGVDPYLSFALMLSSDGTKITFAQTTGAAGSHHGIDTATAIPLRTWTHVAAVLTGGQLQLYVNGQLSSSGASAGVPLLAPAVPFSVGLAYLSNDSTNYPAFPGYAQQVRYWNTSRTAAQITAAATQILPSDSTGLVADWPLDDTSGTTARDISGAGRLLTAIGGIQSAPVSLLAAGPFFSTSTTAVTDGSLNYVTDGQLIDFNSDGALDLILMQVYGPPTVPGTPTQLRVFRNQGGVFTDVTNTVLGNVTMIHPRASVVADFNGDGWPDIFIAGHGTDTPPIPGNSRDCCFNQRTASWWTTPQRAYRPTTASRIQLPLGTLTAMAI